MIPLLFTVFNSYGYWIQTLGIGSNLGTAGEWPSLRVQEGDYLLDGEVFELDSSSSYRGVKID